MNFRPLLVAPIFICTLAAGPALAQNTGTAPDRTAATRVDTDDGFDWGLLGLLGLAGLLGLKRRDTDTYTRTGTSAAR